MEKEKKEIRKLIELLNEYRMGAFVYDNDILRFRLRDRVKIEGNAILISKSFGFIKWLVENDKININEEWDDYEKTNLYCNSDFFQLQKHYSYYESLLMLLSIQDEPIEFLCAILK